MTDSLSAIGVGSQRSAICQRVADLLARTNRRVVFAESCTAGLVPALLAAIPGISQHLCGSAVTYREDTKSRWLGVPAEVLRDYSAVSLPVAERMAVEVLKNTPEADISLSVTGHLGPNAPDHQDGLIYVGSAARVDGAGPARVVPLGVYEHRLPSEDRGSRQYEAAEYVLSRLERILAEPVVSRGTEAAPELDRLGTALVRVAGRWLRQDGTDPSRPRPAVLFPGAFHPLHRGHQEIADAAEAQLGVRPQFEIAIENVDKAPIAPAEIGRRAGQFPPQETLWLTRASTFLMKARLFPGTTFLVGADTIVRIAAVTYYDHDIGYRDRAIQEIAQLGCRFLVYGRLIAGRFTTLDDLELPGDLGKMCKGVPAEMFRQDIASTDLRRKV